MVSFLFIYVYGRYWRKSFCIIILVETKLLVTKIEKVVPPPQVTKLL